MAISQYYRNSSTCTVENGLLTTVLIHLLRASFFLTSTY